MTCFAYDGVEKIKEAMRAGQQAGTTACPVSIKLVAAPRYVLTTQTLDKAQVRPLGAEGGAEELLLLCWGWAAAARLPGPAGGPDAPPNRVLPYAGHAPCCI